ncbi:hypothetical protein B0H66DRAFT_537183 [Apodospora peruviana]|uniref:Uncharacterized protein n=1 Tax=Apodospora peruviana TaxID=516989 RepID=A0AAE0HWL5_9PEZI|nr:hypothetical protein B0H66DRAFT_537183 [Apodospora peruviana]
MARFTFPILYSGVVVCSSWTLNFPSGRNAVSAIIKSQSRHPYLTWKSVCVCPSGARTDGDFNKREGTASNSNNTRYDGLMLEGGTQRARGNKQTGPEHPKIDKRLTILNVEIQNSPEDRSLVIVHSPVTLFRGHQSVGKQERGKVLGPLADRDGQVRRPLSPVQIWSSSELLVSPSTAQITQNLRLKQQILSGTGQYTSQCGFYPIDDDPCLAFCLMFTQFSSEFGVRTVHVVKVTFSTRYHYVMY